MCSGGLRIRLVMRMAFCEAYEWDLGRGGSGGLNDLLLC